MLNAVEEMKKNSPKRKFKQSVELVMRLKEIDLKKQESRITEAIQLPNPVGKAIKVCFIAGGDLAVRAKNAGADLILSREDLDRLGKEKKEARKIAREYDHFVSEAPLMPLVGKTLGAILGPRGKMPAPVPSSAVVEDVLTRQRGMIRIRVRDQPVVQCRVGMEDMPSEEIVQNVETVVNGIEGKLERGMGNIGTVLIKTAMGPPVKIPLSKA